MKNICKCFNAKTSCFTGLCLNCNGVVKKSKVLSNLGFLDMSSKIVGTYCNTCRKPYCVCNKIKVE